MSTFSGLPRHTPLPASDTDSWNRLVNLTLPPSPPQTVWIQCGCVSLQGPDWMIPNHRDVCSTSTLQQRRNWEASPSHQLADGGTGVKPQLQLWAPWGRLRVQAWAPACFIKPLTHGQVVFIIRPHPARAQQGAEHWPTPNLVSENLEQEKERCLTFM